MAAFGMIVVLHAADDGAQEYLRDFKVIDCAAPNRPMHFGIVRLAAHKSKRRRSDRNNFPAVFVYRDDRGFVQNDTFCRGVNHRVDRPQIDRQILAEETTENIHSPCSSLSRKTVTATVESVSGDRFSCAEVSKLYANCIDGEFDARRATKVNIFLDSLQKDIVRCKMRRSIIERIGQGLHQLV